MIRSLAIAVPALATVALLTGCGVRQSDLPGSYTEGGFGSPFYAEVPYAAKEGQKPRIYLFGKIAHYEHFLEKKEVPENAHKKFIGKGKNRETLVVQDLTGFELKDNPKYADKLVAKYRQRNGVTDAPMAESAPAPAPAAESAPAPAVAPALEAAPK